MEVVFTTLLGGREQRVTGLFTEGFEIFHRAGIGRDNTQYLPGAKGLDAFLGAQYG
jgi:hypothetical protein